MLAHFGGLADDLAAQAKDAGTSSRRNFERETEDTIAVRFLQSLSENIEEYAATAPFELDIDTYKLRDRGPNSPESEIGADFVICYSFQLPDFQLSQGILIQAKKQDRNGIVTVGGMRDQCNRMLQWSPASFVYLFTSKGNRMYPALQIFSTNSKRPEYAGRNLEFDRAYERKTTLKFFKLFFKGHVGDNWVYQNTNYLTDPSSSTPIERPLVPDGGQDEGNRSGVRVLAVVISSPNTEVTLPFDREYAVDSFEEFGSGSQFDW